MTKEEIIAQLAETTMSDDEKAMWKGRIESEGLTPEMMMEFRDALEASLDASLKASGVNLDEDPAVQEANKEMEETIAEAEKEFEAGMKELDEELEDARVAADAAFAKAEEDQAAEEADKIREQL